MSTENLNYGKTGFRNSWSVLKCFSLSCIQKIDFFYKSWTEKYLKNSALFSKEQNTENLKHKEKNKSKHKA